MGTITLRKLDFFFLFFPLFFPSPTFTQQALHQNSSLMFCLKALAVGAEVKGFSCTSRKGVESERDLVFPQQRQREEGGKDGFSGSQVETADCGAR